MRVDGDFAVLSFLPGIFGHLMLGFMIYAAYLYEKKGKTKIKINENSWIVWVFLLGIFDLVGGCLICQSAKYYIDNGTEVTANITNITTNFEEDIRRECTIDITYEIDGRILDTSLDSNIWPLVPPIEAGDTLQIYYLPQLPRYAVAVDVELRYGYIYIIVGIVICILGVIILIWEKKKPKLPEKDEIIVVYDSMVSTVTPQHKSDSDS